MDIQTIINGHDYFYCERTKCRLRLSVCIKRQESNKDNQYASHLCEHCSRVRAKCRLHLPVCLKSPNVNKQGRQSFSICKNCSQGNENIISDNFNKKQKINLSILACSTAENHNEGKDKGIGGKAVLGQTKERKNHFIDKNSIQI